MPRDVGTYPKIPGSGRKKAGRPPGALNKSTLNITKLSVQETLDKIMTVKEMFEILASHARGTSRKYSLDAIKTLLAYRLGKPPTIIEQHFNNSKEELDLLAKTFGNKLMSLPNVDTTGTGDTAD